MPDESQSIALDREYSMKEFDRLRAGMVPQEMEDHWFLYFEEPWLYLHRSWTGFCIYRVRFELAGTRARVAEAIVNRRSDQNRGTADEGGRLAILLDTQAGRDTEGARLDYIRSVRTASSRPSGERSFLIGYVLTLLLGAASAFGVSWLIGLSSPGLRVPIFIVVTIWWLWIAWRHARTRGRRAA